MAFLIQAFRAKACMVEYRERALGSIILAVIIIFYATIKAVSKPLQTLKREQEGETKTKERMRSLLGTNAFTLKTQKQRVLADKKAVWLPQPCNTEVTFQRLKQAHSSPRTEQKLFQAIASFMKYSIDMAY